ELLRPLARLLAARLSELLRVAAFGIVRAGDERPEPPAAKGEPAVAALRTDPRIGSVLPRRVQPRREGLIERLGDLRGLLVHDVAGLRLEVAPEFREQFLPVEAPARHVVELFLALGGVIVAPIFLEEALEERG